MRQEPKLLDYDENAGQYYPHGVIELVLSPEGILFYRNEIGGVYAVIPDNKSDPICILKDSNSSMCGLVLGKNGVLYVHSGDGILIISDITSKIKNRNPLLPLLEKTQDSCYLKITPDNRRLISANTRLNIWKINNDATLELEKSFSFGEGGIVRDFAISREGDIAVIISNWGFALFSFNQDFYCDTSKGVDYFGFGTFRGLHFDQVGVLYIAHSSGVFVCDIPNRLHASFIKLEDIVSDRFCNLTLRNFSMSKDGYCYIGCQEPGLSSNLLVKKIFPGDPSKTLADTSFATIHTNQRISYINAEYEGGIYLCGDQKLKFLPMLKNRAWEKNLIKPKLEDPINLHAEFIVKEYYLKPFPDGKPRKKHGALHACRAAILGVILINLRRRRNCPFMEDITEKSLKLIEIALLLHDAGRQACGVDHWDRESATLGYNYIREIAPEEEEGAEYVGHAIINKDSYHEYWVINSRAPKAKLEKSSWERHRFVLNRNCHHIIVHDADCADNKRTKLAWHDSYLDYVKTFLSDEDRAVPCEARKDLMCALYELDQLLFYTGDAPQFPDEKLVEFYNNRITCYQDLLQLMKEKSLNNLLALYAGGKMLSVEEAQAIKLGSYILSQPDFFFKKFCTDRSDYEFPDLLFSFTRSPVNLTRRSLRMERDPSLQVFSIRPQRDLSEPSLIYEIQRLNTPLATPMYSYDQKKAYSKATGLGYCSPLFGFSPRVYREHASDEIGIVFPRESVLISRIFQYSPSMSTYYRFYEKSTFEEAQALLRALVRGGKIFNSLECLVDRGRNDKGYQVMGRITHSEEIKICLFSPDSEKAKKRAEKALVFFQVRVRVWARENRKPIPNIKTAVIYYLPGHPLHLQEYKDRHYSPPAVEADFEAIEEEVSMEFRRKFSHLHFLAAHNDLSELSKALQAPGIQIDITDIENQTPLFYAAANGHVEAMIHLILAGANIKHQDNKRQVFIDLLFQFCLFSAYVRMLQVLVEQNPGAQKTVKDLLFSDKPKTRRWMDKVYRYEKNNQELVAWYEENFVDTFGKIKRPNN